MEGKRPPTKEGLRRWQTEGVRKYAVEQGIAEEEALKNNGEEKSKEFAEKGNEIYAKARNQSACQKSASTLKPRTL